MKEIVELIGLVIWPLTIVFFILFFKKKLNTAFDSIKKLKLSDFEAEFDKREEIFTDEEVNPLYADMQDVIERLTKLERTNTKEIPIDKSAAYKRIDNALRDSRFKWRAVPTLAAISGLEMDEAMSYLQENENVILTKGKSGKRIAKFK